MRPLVNVKSLTVPFHYPMQSVGGVLIALSEAVNRGWIYPLNSVTHGQLDARATTTFLASPNFRCMLPMAMTQSFAGGVAKCRVLLTLWMTSCSGCNKPRKDDASRREARIFTAHRYASAVYAVVVCPSVCLSVLLSVTSRCCIETTGRIELFFWHGGFLPPVLHL